jgi:hypothetical protein
MLCLRRQLEGVEAAAAALAGQLEGAVEAVAALQAERQAATYDVAVRLRLKQGQVRGAGVVVCLGRAGVEW